MPRATGSRRIGWPAIPDEVAAAIERLLGGEVVDAIGQPGGFSEGLAARVRLANGGRAFVKAASSLTAPAAADFHRREIEIARRLPGDLPASRLLDAYDDGTWVALVFEEIPGRLPAQPWRRDELDRVLTAVTDLARALTPSPVDPAILGAPRLGGWPALMDDAVKNDDVLGRLATLSPWAAGRLDELAALEETAPLALAGETLLHGDLYPFNIMLTEERVFVVDWPHAWVGAAHCDVVTLLSSASLSGTDPQPLAETHPLTRDLEPARIDALLASHAGFLLRRAVSAGPEADRNLVDMMVALGRASLDWLRDRR
ncbi:aminoglycoside phosphotransferase family protein [Streptomyces sp. NPDC056909]|uniref:aminoglycoside phosphotransferase family protein n=1 Tax=Streptomyces sp. NPDC056909 TaxID=3345963 RepID=UPI0036831819